MYIYLNINSILTVIVYFTQISANIIELHIQVYVAIDINYISKAQRCIAEGPDLSLLRAYSIYMLCTHA